MQEKKESDILFKVSTPLGFYVKATNSYWELITTVKHPSMSGLETEVKKALEKPEEIRQSKSDSAVYLFYKEQKPGRWVCAVVKKFNKKGFLITAYLTNNIKEGAKIWPK